MRENEYPGTFIVIEGPDAAGKHTQASRIVDWLRSEGHSMIDPEKEQRIIERMPGEYPSGGGVNGDTVEDGVWKLSFPTYDQTPGGRVVQAYLDGRLGDREELSMQDRVNIYAADRKQFKHVIEEYLSHGGIVVCDRYREANLIHQLVGFEGEEWERNLEYIKSIDADLPDADRVFYLHIEPEEALERLSGKEKDMHELDEDYMKASNRNGRKVAEHQGWHVVDGEAEPGEVETRLRSEVENIIGDTN